MLSKRKQANNQHSFAKQRRYSGSNKTYTNPFFESKKKRQQKSINKASIPLKVKIIIISVLSFFISIFYFSFYSSYFLIKSIEARGGEGLNPRDIETLAWSQINDSAFIPWQQKNIFIFDKEELIETLNLKYSFNDVIVNKKLPNKIIINYNEKEHSLMWLEKDIYYYTDIHGYVIERIGDKPEDKNYPLIENKSSFFIDSNRVAIDQVVIDYALLLLDKMSPYEDMLIDRFIIEDDNTTIKIQIKDGPKLFFNISGDADKQINKIVTLKNEILKEDFYKKEYIDVRIGDRVYHR